MSGPAADLGAPAGRAGHLLAIDHCAGPLVDLQVLDLDRCDRVEIVTALLAGETAAAQYDTWPAAVRQRFAAEFARWTEDNPDRRVVMVSTGCETRAGRTAVALVIHHRKGQADAART